LWIVGEYTTYACIHSITPPAAKSNCFSKIVEIPEGNGGNLSGRCCLQGETLSGRRLAVSILALSVACGDTSPRGRGFGRGGKFFGYRLTGAER